MDNQSSGESESDDEELQFDRIREGKPKKQLKYCFKFSVDQTIFSLGVESESVYCGVLIDAKTSDSQISQLLFFPGLRGGRIDYDKKTLPIEVQISDRDMKSFAEFRYCYAVSAQPDKQVGKIDSKKITCSKWYETNSVVDTKEVITFGSTEEVISFFEHNIPDEQSACITLSERVDLCPTETDNGSDKVATTGPLTHVVKSKLEEKENQMSSTQLHQSSVIADETLTYPKPASEPIRAKLVVCSKDDYFKEKCETTKDTSTTSELCDSNKSMDKQSQKECPETYMPSSEQSLRSESSESKMSHDFRAETVNHISSISQSVLVETTCKFQKNENLKEVVRNSESSPNVSEKNEYGQSVPSVVKNKREDKTSVPQPTKEVDVASFNEYPCTHEVSASITSSERIDLCSTDIEKGSEKVASTGLLTHVVKKELEEKEDQISSTQIHQSSATPDKTSKSAIKKQEQKECPETYGSFSEQSMRSESSESQVSHGFKAETVNHKSSIAQSVLVETTCKVGRNEKLIEEVKKICDREFSPSESEKTESGQSVPSVVKNKREDKISVSQPTQEVEVASFNEHACPHEESASITPIEKVDLGSTEIEKGSEKVASTGSLTHAVMCKLEGNEDQISSSQLHQSSAIGDETSKSSTEKQDQKECPETYGSPSEQSVISEYSESQVSHGLNAETVNHKSSIVESVLVETRFKVGKIEKLQEEGKSFGNDDLSLSEREKTEYGQSVSRVIKNKREDKTSVSHSTHIVQAIVDKEIFNLGKDSLIISLTTINGSHTSQGVVVAATDDWAILSFDVKLRENHVPYFYRLHAPKDVYAQIHREILPDRVSYRVMNDKDFTGEENNVKMKYDGVICWYKNDMDLNSIFASQRKTEDAKWLFTDKEFFKKRNLTGFEIYCSDLVYCQLSQNFNLEQFYFGIEKIWKSLSTVRFENNSQITIMESSSVSQHALEVLFDQVKNGSSENLDLGIVFLVNFLHQLNKRKMLAGIKRETTSSIRCLVQNTDDKLQSRLTEKLAELSPEIQPNAKLCISKAQRIIEKCKSNHETVKWVELLSIEDSEKDFFAPRTSQNLPELQPHHKLQENDPKYVSEPTATCELRSRQSVSTKFTKKQDETMYSFRQCQKDVLAKSSIIKEPITEPEIICESRKQYVGQSSIDPEPSLQSPPSRAEAPNLPNPESEIKIDFLKQQIEQPSLDREYSLQSPSFRAEAHSSPNPEEEINLESRKHQVGQRSFEPCNISQNTSNYHSSIDNKKFNKAKKKVDNLAGAVKVEYFNSSSDKNKKSTCANVISISNERYKSSDLGRNHWKFLTVIDTDITQIKGDLMVFMFIENIICYGKVEAISDNWAILRFEVEPIESEDSYIRFFFGVKSTDEGQERHYREVLPGEHQHRYLRVDDLKDGLLNYSGAITWKKSESSFLEKGWNLVKYLKGHGDYFNPHSKAFEVYCMHYASQFVDDLDLGAFTANVKSSWSCLSRVCIKKNVETVFKEELAPHQLLDTMVNVVKTQQGFKRDLAKIALLELTDLVLSSEKTLKVVKESTLAEVVCLTGFETKERRDELGKEMNSRQYDEKIRKSKQACFSLIQHRGNNDRHLSNLFEWLSLSNTPLSTPFKTPNLSPISPEFFCSVDTRIQILVSAINWESVNSLQKIGLSMDLYIYALHCSLLTHGITDDTNKNSLILIKSLTEKLRLEDFNKCAHQINLLLNDSKIRGGIVFRNIILLALDIAEITENYAQDADSLDKQWFDVITKHARTILHNSLQIRPDKTTINFWIKICTKKLELNCSTNRFRGNLGDIVINFLCDNPDAMSAVANADKHDLEQSLLASIFKHSELNELAKQFNFKDRALFDINHKDHRSACDRIFHDLLAIFKEPHIQKPYGIVECAAHLPHLVLLITSYPKLNPNDNCKRLMQKIVEAYLNASKQIDDQSISFENLRVIQGVMDIFIAVCNQFSRWNWNSDDFIAFDGLFFFVFNIFTFF